MSLSRKAFIDFFRNDPDIIEYVLKKNKHLLTYTSPDDPTIKKILSEVKKNKVVYILGMPIWPTYMRVKGQNLIDKYDKFKINREMTLHTANLDADIKETKTYCKSKYLSKSDL